MNLKRQSMILPGNPLILCRNSMDLQEIHRTWQDNLWISQGHPSNLAQKALCI